MLIWIFRILAQKWFKEIGTFYGLQHDKVILLSISKFIFLQLGKPVQLNLLCVMIM